MNARAKTSPLVQMPEADWQELEREACRRSLVEFIRLAWPVIEPSQPYVHGWHIDAIAEHLMAVSRGQINRLSIEVPPGTMKSLAVSVFWPAWEWGPFGTPSNRYVATSHSERLAVRDNLRARRLIQSEWYQRRWPTTLVSDQNAKTKFENNKTGFREAMPFTSLTGTRGDRVLIDDPLSVDDALSEAKRNAVNTTFLEAVPTRLNNPSKSAIVVVMQRLHQRDVVGTLEAKALGYERLVLPMEFEPERRCKTSIGFVDPRTKDGELLFPARYPRIVLDRDRRAMGSYAWAGQMQQRPAPREGGLFKRHWFEVVDALPRDALGNGVRRWDIAATEEIPGRDPDYLAGVRMFESNGVYYVDHVVRDRLSPAGVEKLVKATAEADGKSIRVRLPQDPGAAGKIVGKAYVSMLAGWDVRATLETGSKIVRATPVSAQAEAGNIKLVRGPWVEDFLSELCDFPNGAHDDQVDALSGAFAELIDGSTYSLEDAL